MLTGRDFLEWLSDAGIVPPTATRVVIEASLVDIVRIYVETYGTEGLVRVLKPKEMVGQAMVLVPKGEGQ